MGEVKHTPGEWGLDDHPQGAAIRGGCTELVAVVVDPSKARAGVTSASEREANARLIAASPDLLEALQNFVGLYDSPVERRRKASDPFYAEVVSVARAAIDKATGSDQ